MRNKLLCIALLFVAFFICNCGVKAENLDKENNVVITVVDKKNKKSDFSLEIKSDIIGESSTKSLSIPTAYWNLSSSDYHGTLTEVRVNWLYTNYYFYPNSSGKLYLDYDIEPINVAGTKMYIRVYDITTSSEVALYTSGGSPTSSCIQVSGLNTSHKYAFAFRAKKDLGAYNGVKGTITVYH